jgi:hypothetical protein
MPCPVDAQPDLLEDIVNMLQAIALTDAELYEAGRDGAHKSSRRCRIAPLVEK